MRVERGLEGRDELVKLVKRQAGEIQELHGAGLQIGEPYTGHRWCLLSWEAQYTINRDELSWASRRVRRAHGAVTVGSRSVKMSRRQWRLRQNHLRTRSWRRTRYSAHGRSARVRSSRLWIRRAGMAHSGQGTLACVECTRRVICADVVST